MKVLGCTQLFQTVPKSCTIWIITDDELVRYGYAYDIILRHELPSKSTRVARPRLSLDRLAGAASAHSRLLIRNRGPGSQPPWEPP